MKFLIFGLILFSAAVYMSNTQALPTRQELIKRANDLIRRAREEVQKLRDSGKQNLAGPLEQLERHVAELERQLQRLNPNDTRLEDTIRKIETELNREEERLAAELKRLTDNTQTVIVVDLKTVLLRRAVVLVLWSRSAVEDLRRQGNQQHAAELERLERMIDVLEVQLIGLQPNNQNTHVELQKVEVELNQLESDLLDELTRLKQNGHITEIILPGSN